MLKDSKEATMSNQFYVLKFGKYQNLTLNAVAVIDPQYLYWLQGASTNSELSDALNPIIRKMEDLEMQSECWAGDFEFWK